MLKTEGGTAVTASMWLETAFGFCIFLMWALAVCHLFDGRRVHRLLAVAGAAVFAVGYACICFYAPDGSMPDQQFRQSLRGIYTPLCLLLFPLFFRRVPLLRRLGAGALFLCFTFFTDALLTIAALCAGFTPEAGRFSGFWQRLVFLALNLLLYGLAAGLTCRILRRRTLKLQAQTVALLCSLVLPFFCMVVVLLNGLSDTADSYARFSTVLLTLASVVLFLAAGGIAVHLHKISLEAERLRLQNRMDYESATMLRDEKQEFRKVKHDLSNLLTVARGYIEIGKPEKALAVLSDTQAQLGGLSGFTACANETVNVVLYIKQNQAKAAGARLAFDVAESDGARVDDYDLCRVLFNLIDNGLHAVEPLPEAERTVKLRLSIEKERLQIETQNPYLPARRKTKQSGTGTDILRGICKKYGGSYTAFPEDGVYRTVTVLENRPPRGQDK